MHNCEMYICITLHLDVLDGKIATAYKMLGCIHALHCVWRFMRENELLHAECWDEYMHVTVSGGS